MLKDRILIKCRAWWASTWYWATVHATIWDVQQIWRSLSDSRTKVRYSFILFLPYLYYNVRWKYKFMLFLSILTRTLLSFPIKYGEREGRISPPDYLDKKNWFNLIRVLFCLAFRVFHDQSCLFLSFVFLVILRGLCLCIFWGLIFLGIRSLSSQLGLWRCIWAVILGDLYNFPVVCSNLGIIKILFILNYITTAGISLHTLQSFSLNFWIFYIRINTLKLELDVTKQKLDESKKRNDQLQDELKEVYEKKVRFCNMAWISVNHESKSYIRVNYIDIS